MNTTPLSTISSTSGTSNPSSTQYFELKDAQLHPQEFINQLLSIAETKWQRAQLLLENQIRFGEVRQDIYKAITILQSIIEKEEAWITLGMDKETMWEKIQYTTII